MSAEVCVVYFGLRYEIGQSEIEGLEERTDLRIVAARNAGLKLYWANFSNASPNFLLFVGAELARLGPENSLAVALSADDLQMLIERTFAKLLEAGLQGDPALHMQWGQDI